MFPLGKVSFTKPANLDSLWTLTAKTIGKKSALCGSHGWHKNKVLDKEIYLFKVKL